ncbi:hypothetical protein JHW43_005854 [Diplocarpon mali]|nr:hypothetical protein JHW43_005854 [Diplocarpon mali]
MRLAVPLVGLVGAAVTSAARLYASSYAGTVSTLSLSEAAGRYALTTTSDYTVLDTNPSWVTRDARNGHLYLVDEGFTGSSSVASFAPAADGDLTRLGRSATVSGPVSSVVYNGGRGLAVAHYGGSAVTSWIIGANGTLSPLQEITFNLTAPGANPARQEAPHPHQVLTDPTDSFIAVPDLGADVVRIFSIDRATSALTERASLATAAGCGPRHGVFLQAECGNTYLYVLCELSNILTSYNVTYGPSSLSFEPVFASGTYGPHAVPAGSAAAEPDHRFLLTSDRNASVFEIANPDPSNGTALPSDTLQTWAVDDATGTLSFVQLAPAGGRYPRQFSVNKAGTLVAVGLQKDGRVAILERNVATGEMGSVVASVELLGEVSCVIWEE